MERKRDSLLFLVSFSVALSFLALAFQAAFDYPRPAPTAFSRPQPTDRIDATPNLKEASEPRPPRPPAHGTMGMASERKYESGYSGGKENILPARGKKAPAVGEETPVEAAKPGETASAASPPEERGNKPPGRLLHDQGPGIGPSGRLRRSPLIARPGEDLRVRPGQEVILDGRPSSPEGDPGRLVYSWRLLERPRGSETGIPDPQSGRTLLVPDRPGLYAVELRIREGKEGQEGEEELPRHIVITAEGSPAAVPDVTGLPLEEARRRLEEAGIGLERISVRAGTGEPDGRVLAQDPPAGSVLAATIAARLVIALSPQADTDLDGLADAWEYEMFGNLDQDASGDADGDGFSNLQEFRSGTHPGDHREAPVSAANLFEYDRYGRLVFKQIALEP